MEESSNVREPGKQFSFHRSPIESSSRESTSCSESTKSTLHRLPHSTLIDICLDSLQENEFLKAEHFKTVNQLISHTSQLSDLKQKVEKKRETIRCLIENHSKLTIMFEQHMKICCRQEIKPQEYWQKKFKELQHYMNLYITQSNQVQEEYLRGFNRLKDENERVYIQISDLNRKIRSLQVQKSANELQENKHYESRSSLPTSLEICRIQNQRMRKQIQKFSEQKSRLEADIALLHNSMEGLKQKARGLEIENASMKAQLYLRNGDALELQPTATEGLMRKADDLNGNPNKRSKILIPPLNIQQSLEKIKRIQRSHSAAHL